MSSRPLFYPLLGTFRRKSSAVLPVNGEPKEISNELFPLNALKYLQDRCGKSSIATANVTYDGSKLLEAADKTQVLNVFFHNCVFNRVQDNHHTVQAGVYLPDSQFAPKVVTSDNRDGLPIFSREAQGALREFRIGLESYDNEVSWSFCEDKVRLKIDTRVPVLSFFSILSYELQGIQYIYATRHLIILHPSSTIGLRTRAMEHRVEMFFRLSQTVVSQCGGLYTEDNFDNQLTYQLFGYQVDDGTRAIYRDFLQFMVYKNDCSSEDIKSRDSNFGGNTYKTYCESAGSGTVVQVQAAKSWLKQMWRLTVKEILEYFLLS